MKLKTSCKMHPQSEVYILEATVSFWRNGKAVPESSERATEVVLDEYNLYCTGEHGMQAMKDGEHDMHFEVEAQ